MYFASTCMQNPLLPIYMYKLTYTTMYITSIHEKRSYNYANRFIHTCVLWKITQTRRATLSRDSFPSLVERKKKKNKKKLKKKTMTRPIIYSTKFFPSFNVVEIFNYFTGYAIILFRKRLSTPMSNVHTYYMLYVRDMQVYYVVSTSTYTY